MMPLRHNNIHVEFHRIDHANLGIHPQSVVDDLCMQTNEDHLVPFPYMEV